MKRAEFAFHLWMLTHCIYCVRVKRTEYRTRLRLLAVAPLPSLDPDNDDEESAQFNATAHINFFVQTLLIYGKSYDEYVICHNADNASVNIKIAKDSHGRHGPCNAHTLGLAGVKMLENDEDLKMTVDACTAVGAHARNSCKVATSLRNLAAAVDTRLANITPKTQSTTRQWLGAAVILTQHKKLAPHYSQLQTDNIANMRRHTDSTNVLFLDDVDEHLKYLKRIRQCSEMNQKHGLQLKDTQGALNLLHKEITDGQDVPGKYLAYSCLD